MVRQRVRTGCSKRVDTNLKLREARIQRLLKDSLLEPLDNSTNASRIYITGDSIRPWATGHQPRFLNSSGFVSSGAQRRQRRRR